jgi:hypothetical protein
MAKLYHLDWKGCHEADPQLHIGIIHPFDGDVSFVESISKAFAAGHYKPVAVLDTDDPEQVFARTQNLDQGWTESETLVILSAGPFRSTAVGDLIELEDGFVAVNSPFGMLTLPEGWNAPLPAWIH